MTNKDRVIHLLTTYHLMSITENEHPSPHEASFIEARDGLIAHLDQQNREIDQLEGKLIKAEDRFQKAKEEDLVKALTTLLDVAERGSPELLITTIRANRNHYREKLNARLYP